MELDFNLDDLLWSAVRRYSSKKSPHFIALNNEDDLFCVLKATALIAISKYQNDKDTKMKTWVFECVKRRLIDISREEKRKPKIYFNPEREQTSFSPSSDIHAMEFEFTMQAILTEDEYRVFRLHYHEDASIREVSEVLNFSTRKVRACLLHISQKYRLTETSQVQILTRRRLQDRWLNTFGD